MKCKHGVSLCFGVRCILNIHKDVKQAVHFRSCQCCNESSEKLTYIIFKEKNILLSFSWIMIEAVYLP